jgi:hypothetical protein
MLRLPAVPGDETYRTGGPGPFARREHDWGLCASESEPTIDQIRLQQAGPSTRDPRLSILMVFAAANAVIDDREARMRRTKCPEGNLDLSTAPTIETVMEGVDDRLAGGQHKYAALVCWQ